MTSRVKITSLIDGTVFIGQVIDSYQHKPGGSTTVEFITADGMRVSALEDDIDVTPAS